VPTADEYFETACHRARVDRSGRAFEGQPELTRRSIGSGLPPPCGEDEPCCPGPPAQPPSVQRRTTAPRRLVPRSPGPWAAESEPRTGCSRSAPGAVDAGGPRVAGWAGFPPRAGGPGGRVYREVYMVWSESSTDAGDGSPCGVPEVGLGR
jgi:hypothetical protein